jgi:hypothetical protein
MVKQETHKLCEEFNYEFQKTYQDTGVARGEI